MAGTTAASTSMVRLGVVTLRATHTVYDAGGRYLVERTRRRDGSVAGMQPVSAAAVETIAQLLGTGLDTIEDLARAVEHLSPARRGFASSYGHQLRYEVERALLVLIARGAVAVEQQGRSFFFSAVAAPR